MVNGLGSIYLNPEAYNHPLNMYLVKLMSYFFSDPASITATSVNWPKVIVFPFNLLSILLVVFLLKQNGMATSGVCWLILNPAFWYNTVIWGQFYVVFTFYAFLALILAECKSWKLAWLSFLAALNFKLQAIVIAPLLPILTYRSINYDSFKGKLMKGFKNIWASAEVFNLLQINNVISYLWIKDVSGRSYAVPNYLTSRQINIKLHFEF